MKQFLIYIAVLVVGGIVGALIALSALPPVNPKMARINESRLIEEVNWLEQLSRGDTDGVMRSLNREIDKELSTVFLWSREKQKPSDAAKESIHKIETLRQTMTENGAPYRVNDDIAEQVTGAFTLIHEEQK
jgi:hypothetical protein